MGQDVVAYVTRGGANADFYSERALVADLVEMKLSCVRSVATAALSEGRGC